MNTKHRVHRIRYIDWNAMDDDSEYYANELMSENPRRRRKRDHQTDSVDSEQKPRNRKRSKPVREPNH
jgi:hypothetical protein